MDRRDALTGISLLLGTVISPPVLSGLLAGCTAPDLSGDYSPQTLSDDRFELVGALCDTIIPASATPGATGAGVDRFIDLMLTEHFPAADRENFLEGLATLADSVEREFETNFRQLSVEIRAGYVCRLDESSLADPANDTILESFFRILKELTLVGYYTSEPGAMQELHVNPMGLYRPDVPMAEIVKAWS